MTPYRESTPRPESDGAANGPLVAAYLLALLCVVRLAGGVARGDDLGGEVTISLLVLLFTLPALFRRRA